MSVNFVSMIECEAVCDRLAIMVKGELRCLGTVQQLKDRFGRGYTLTANMARDGGKIPDMNPLKEFINLNFPGIVLYLLLLYFISLHHFLK